MRDEEEAKVRWHVAAELIATQARLFTEVRERSESADLTLLASHQAPLPPHPSRSCSFGRRYVGLYGERIAIACPHARGGAGCHS